MGKIIKHKWKIASLTLITLPLSMSLLSKNIGINESLIIFIGLSPLLFAATIELVAETVSVWQHYKQTGETPSSETEGSPVGNKIAVILAILFGLIFVLPIVWVMVSNL